MRNVLRLGRTVVTREPAQRDLPPRTVRPLNIEHVHPSAHATAQAALPCEPTSWFESLYQPSKAVRRRPPACHGY